MRDCGACRENVSKTFVKNKVPCGDLRSKPAPKKLVFVSLKFRQAQRNCLKLKRGSGNEDEKEESISCPGEIHSKRGRLWKIRGRLRR
jgi:hypothetical protein